MTTKQEADQVSKLLKSKISVKGEDGKRFYYSNPKYPSEIAKPILGADIEIPEDEIGFHNLMMGWFGYDWPLYISHVLSFYAKYLLHDNTAELGRVVATSIKTSNNLKFE